MREIKECQNGHSRGDVRAVEGHKIKKNGEKNEKYEMEGLFRGHKWKRMERRMKSRMKSMKRRRT